jgi:hypothetical protein
MVRITCDLIGSKIVNSIDEIPELFKEYGGQITVRDNEIFQNGNYLATIKILKVKKSDSIKPGSIIRYAFNNWFLTHDNYWVKRGDKVTMNGRIYTFTGFGGDGNGNIEDIILLTAKHSEKISLESPPSPIYFSPWNNEVKLGVQFSAILRVGGFREYQGERDAVLLNTKNGQEWFFVGDKVRYPHYNGSIEILKFEVREIRKSPDGKFEQPLMRYRHENSNGTLHVDTVAEFTINTQPVDRV